MIKILDGNYEKVDYNNKSSILLYVNKEYENYPPHWHTATEIIMPLENSYKAASTKKTFYLNEFDILIIPTGELHELIAPPYGMRLIFQFEPSLLRSIHGFTNVLAFLETLRLITPDNSPVIHSKIKTIMLEIHDEYINKNVLNNASIYSKIIDMYVILARNYMNAETLFPDIKISKQKEYVEKFNDVFEYINMNYTEDLDLDTISNIAGFSKFHFSRIFKNFTDQTFHNYLNQKRVKTAESLLLNPKLSITDVAMQSGFTSISTFNRIFKNIKNCTPSEFKSMYHSRKKLTAIAAGSLEANNNMTHFNS